MDKKVKVLRIIARLNIGGPATHTILLTEGLNKDRFDSLLIVGPVDATEGDMIYLAQEKGVRPIIIPNLGRKINLKDDLVAFWKIYRLIRKERPDIIHTHTAKAGALGRFAGMFYNLVNGCWLPGWPLDRQAIGRKRCKLIHTFHGHVLHSYFGKLETKTFIWIERILAIFTDRIIAVSNRVRQELLTLGICNSKKIATISLGLELERLLMLPYNNSHPLRVGMVGRLVPIKNHRMFLNAIKLLQGQGLGDGVKFLIIGDGELRTELEKYSKKLGIREIVVFRGWQSDLERVYSDLDIVALTSLNEGTPVSFIEAMAAARAVIATDVGGVSDLVSDSKLSAAEVDSKYKLYERGILVDSGDVEAFAGGLRLLLSDRALRQKLGQAGREFVKHRFSKERLFSDIENIYEDLLN